MSNTFKVRNFIKAKSEKRLRLLMFNKQIELGMSALEFDITFAKGFWFAWFYEIANTRAMSEITEKE